MTSNLSEWIRTGDKEKGDLEEDSYKILSQFYKERKNLLNHTEKRSHDQMGHQGTDKIQQRILHRFDWPGLRKACER